MNHECLDLYLQRKVVPLAQSITIAEFYLLNSSYCDSAAMLAQQENLFVKQINLSQSTSGKWEWRTKQIALSLLMLLETLMLPNNSTR